MMKQIIKERNKGFTLAELLIVVAIIAVLVAISIPLFSAQLEKARQATDLANMRSAKGAALADWMMDANGEARAYVYDAQKGRAFISGTADDPVGYGKSSKSASEFASEFNASGIPKDGNSANYITVIVNEVGQTNIIWGASGNMAYYTAITPYKNETLMNLKEMSNSERIAADQTTLKAIGQAILDQNLTLDEFKETFGMYQDGNAVRIANYYQDKTGSFSGEYSSDGFRMDITDDFAKLLKDVGYDGGSSTSKPNTNTKYKDSTNVYTYSNSLFYSDELATNQFKNKPINETMRCIIVDQFSYSNGVITGFRIYSKAMDNQANMDDDEKALFSFKMTK